MKTITLMSGKGGSGKTTLAITMADIFSRCGLKVLLVDCDFSTYGATYLYEDRLVDLYPDVPSFFDVVINDAPPLDGVNIDENFRFLPSVKHAADGFEEYDFMSSDTAAERVRNFIYSVHDTDLIIFDCRSGGSKTLYSVLPNTDIFLVVMEPDAANAQTLRGIRKKIDFFCPSVDIYYVFNKVFNDKKEFCDSLFLGEPFVNAGHLPYDAALPDWISSDDDFLVCGGDYKLHVCSLCDRMINIIFRDKDTDGGISDNLHSLIAKLEGSSRSRHFLDIIKNIRPWITAFLFIISVFVSMFVLQACYDSGMPRFFIILLCSLIMAGPLLFSGLLYKFAIEP